MDSSKIYCDFIKSETITKGWSEDKKYCITVADGTKYLLRITPIARYETRKSLYSMLEQVATLGIPMCVPVEFGTCDEGVYSIQSWIDGEDLETVLPTLSDTEQYVLGVKAGEILRKMHTIFVSDIQSERPDWAESFDHTTEERIQKYHDCGLRFDNDERVLAYLEQNRHLIENRPRCFLHGDYCVRNIMLENGELKIIDFERLYFGDPWEDFIFTMLDMAKKPYFSTGQIRGYFGGEPPLTFFKTYAYYVLSSLLPGHYDAEALFGDEIDKMAKQTQEIMAWFNDLENPIPTWYLKDFYVQWIDGVPYKLLEPYDFSFINKYGKVFTVFDEQGVNVCFGVQSGDERYFVKFAGAKPINFEVCKGNAVLAIEWLKNAVSVYRDLEHPTLIKYISAEEIGGGYATVFEWVDAIGIEPFNSPDYMRFMQMPVNKKIQAFEDILAFHTHAAAKGYVAIDFYDGSILYDYDNEKVIICDIDFYQKSPYIGEMGLWGSSRFVSPEECTPGAVMDEITMVYTMGATAFSLFAYGDRSTEAWTLDTALYDVAKRAVSDDRKKRQQSIEQLIDEWRAAKI